MATSLSAFRAGYFSRLLGYCLDSVWSEDIRQIQEVGPAVEELDSVLLGLSGRMTAFQQEKYAEIQGRIVAWDELVSSSSDLYFEEHRAAGDAPIHAFLFRRLRPEQQEVAA